MPCVQSPPVEGGAACVVIGEPAHVQKRLLPPEWRRAEMGQQCRVPARGVMCRTATLYKCNEPPPAQA